METTPSTSLNVLGPVAIASAGETIVAEHRPRLLFVLLAEQLGDVVPSWQLVDAVWGRLAEPPSTAESALRNYVSGARRVASALGMRLDRRGDGYALSGDLDHFDLRELERMATVCLRDPAAAHLDALRAADALWRGRSLADLRHLTGGDDLGRRLDERHATIRRRLLEALVDTGAVDEAIGELTRLAMADPFDSRLQAVLARAHYFEGRHAEALSLLRDRIAASRRRGHLPPGDLATLESAILDHSLAMPVRSRAGPSVPAELAVLAQQPFFGRDRALLRIAAELDRAIATSRSRVVRVHGEPGVGKSHLLAELARRATENGWQCAFAWSEEGISSPFAPIRRALGTDEDVTVRSVVAASAGDTQDVLFALHERSRNEVRRASGPLLVLLDDCQWLDEQSRIFLRRLAHTPVANAVVVVFAEWTPLNSSPDTGRAVDVEVTTYTADDVQDVASAHSRDDAWAAAVLEMTGGLPLLVHGAVGQTADEILSSDEFERSARVLLSYRWSTVPSHLRPIVQMAAVLGQQFTIDNLLVACDASTDEVFDALDAAYRAGIVGFGSAQPRRCHFVHGLLRTGVEATLTPVEALRLHHRAITRLGPSVDAITAWRYACAAWPLVNSGEVVAVATAAVEQLHANLAFRDALALLERANELFGGVVSSVDARALGRWRLVEGQARSAVGQISRARSLFDESAAQAEAAGDNSTRAQADRLRASLGYVVTENQAMSTRLERALSELGRDAGLDERFQLVHQIVDDALLAGRYVQADGAMTELHELLHREPDDYREALLCGVLHLRAHLRGDTTERRGVVERIRGLRLAATDDRVASRVARVDLIEAIHDGNASAVGRSARRLAELSVRIGEPRATWLGTVAEVNAPLLDGDLDKAQRLADAAVRANPVPESSGKGHDDDGPEREIAESAHFAQSFVMRWLRGDLRDLLGPEPPRQVSETFAWNAALALIHGLQGQYQAVADIVTGPVAALDVGNVQWLDLAGVALAVEAATTVNLSDIAPRARRILERHVDDHIIIGSGVVDLGPAARYLALAEALDGEHDLAVERLEQVLASEATGAVWRSLAAEQLAALPGRALA